MFKIRALFAFNDFISDCFDGGNVTIVGKVVDVLMSGIVILLLNPSIFQRIFESNHSLFELLFCYLDDFLLDVLVAVFAFLFQAGIAFRFLGILVIYISFTKPQPSKAKNAQLRKG